MSKKRLNVFMHVDADPDREPSGDAELLGFLSPGKGKQKWDGLRFTADFLQGFTERLQDMGLLFKCTFFLRADEQIKGLYGTYSETFTGFYDEIKQHFSVGWHPHLYRWSSRYECWYQEWNDNEWIRKVLVDCYDHLKSNGFQPQFSKMGWCFHNNTTIKTLSDVGLTCDFSALPGARYPGSLEGRSFQGRYEWGNTDPKPYHPREGNYQKPGTLRILEVPLTTYGVSGPLVFLYTAKLALESYIRFRLSYRLSSRLTFPLALPVLLSNKNQKKISELMWELKENDYVTLYVHPDELLNPFGRSLFENFIFKMASEANEKGAQISFLSASELYSLASSMQMS